MKILIIKTSSLGDIIHAFPVLQYLRRLYPSAQIDWLVEQSFAELVEAHPDLNHAIPVQIKKWRSSIWKKKCWQEIQALIQRMRQCHYDLVLDLQGNVKSGLLTAMARSQRKVGFGWSTAPEWPNVFFTHERYNPPCGRNIREDYLFLAQNALGGAIPDIGGIALQISSQQIKQIEELLQAPPLQGGPRIVVCPGSNWVNKQLSLEILQAFLAEISKKLGGRFLFVWGSPKEKEIVESLQEQFPNSSLIMDRLPLPVLQSVMSKTQLVIAMDSLPLHLGGTTSTPTYSIFGASSAHKYKPLGNVHHAFQGSCPYGKNFEKRCPILRTCSTGDCIKQIDTTALFNHFFIWWKSLTF